MHNYSSIVRIGVIQFPGSNCERETMLAIQRAGMEPIAHLWNEPTRLLETMHGFVIVGGFSYEDRSRAGVIAAHDPLLAVLCEQAEQGKPILGICNGAQILVEAGLVPGLEHNRLALALTDNRRLLGETVMGTGYYNAWVHIRLSDAYQRNCFTRCMTRGMCLRVPVAHAEGRFVMTHALLDEIKMQGLNVFQYCDATGNLQSEFPINPNGSIDNIAALANKRGNVLAMMPHPERTTAGDPIFHSMREAILEETMQPVAPLAYLPRATTCSRYVKPDHSKEWIVASLITDHQAWTVQQTLQASGLSVMVRRYVHWEIQCQDAKTLAAIQASEVLYCDRKEYLTTVERQATLTAEQEIFMLVRAKDDNLGRQKKQILFHHFDVMDVEAIRYGVLWHLYTPDATIPHFMERILHSHLLENPYAHDVYQYS